MCVAWVCACGVHLWVKGEGRDRGQETSQAKDNTVCVGGGWPVCRVMHVCVGRVCVWCVGAGQGISLCGHACGVWAEAEA